MTGPVPVVSIHFSGQYCPVCVACFGPRPAVGGLHCEGCKQRAREEAHEAWLREEASWGDMMGMRERDRLHRGMNNRMLRGSRKSNQRRLKHGHVVTPLPARASTAEQYPPMEHIAKPSRTFSESFRRVPVALRRYVRLLVETRDFTQDQAITAVMQMNGV